MHVLMATQAEDGRLAPARDESLWNESLWNESLWNESLWNESLWNESLWNESLGNAARRKKVLERDGRSPISTITEKLPDFANIPVFFRTIEPLRI